MDDFKNSEINNEDMNLHTSSNGESSPLDNCRSELNQSRDRIMYLQAEFDNYKKRIDKERTAWIESAQDVILEDVVSLVDDMERALQGLQGLPAEQKVHVTGVEMIAKSFAKLLQKYDLQEIPYAKTFNPEYYEAIMQVAADDHASGEIVAILQKGYTRKGRVLRPAKVSVAQ